MHAAVQWECVPAVCLSTSSRNFDLSKLEKPQPTQQCSAVNHSAAFLRGCDWILRKEKLSDSSDEAGEI